ncbi:MAG: tetratricopeptide repeat protein [Bacteroidales bacterium]|nr:tetratricopeptide repeat protein [Bacteroidales bacterium]
MYKKAILVLMVAATVAATGCGSGKKAAVGKANPFERPPIREVTEEQLAEDGMLIDALALQETERADEALEAYARTVEKHPGCGAAWYGMSQLLAQRGWTDSAEACARRAVALKGDNVWYLLALAMTQQMKGDSRGLLDTWETIVRQNPEVLDYYYELSNQYIASGNLTKAVEVLNRVEKRIGVTEPISMQKAKLWNAAGKPEKAMAEVEALAKAVPGDKQSNAILAEMNMQQKRYSKAKTYYDRILEADPDDPYIHIQLAEYYKAVGNAAEADSEMVRAFDNPALDGKSKLQLLGSFYSNEEFFGSRSATTFRLMDKAMADCADSTEFAAFYGNVLFNQQRYPEAARQMELALQRDSSMYEVWELLLISLSATPEREADLGRYARRAAALFPVHTMPHFMLAQQAVLAERYDEALRELETAARWGFSKGYLEAETYGLMGEAYYRTGQYDKAWQAFDRCLALRPDDMGTLNNYAYYLSEQNTQLEKAERMSRRTIEAQPDNANNLDTYAWILHLLGRDREALPLMEKAVRLDPKSDTLREHLEAIRNK